VDTFRIRATRIERMSCFAEGWRVAGATIDRLGVRPNKALVHDGRCAPAAQRQGVGQAEPEASSGAGCLPKARSGGRLDTSVMQGENSTVSCAAGLRG
jgi:hypothetical protein